MREQRAFRTLHQEEPVRLSPLGEGVNENLGCPAIFISLNGMQRVKSLFPLGALCRQQENAWP
jgi:hypothetical protein